MKSWTSLGIFSDNQMKKRKVTLMEQLIDPWKNEDQKNPHKIYNICMDK